MSCRSDFAVLNDCKGNTGDTVPLDELLYARGEDGRLEEIHRRIIQH